MITRIILILVLVFAFVIPSLAGQHCRSDSFPPNYLEFNCNGGWRWFKVSAYQFGSWPKYASEVRVYCNGLVFIPARYYHCGNEGNPWEQNPEPKWIQIQAYNKRLDDIQEFLDDYNFDWKSLRDLWK